MDHAFYKLDEAAKLIGCETNDLLKLGAEGRIELCLWYTGDFINRLSDYHTEAQGIVLPWNAWGGRKQILILDKDDIMHLYVNGWTDVASLDWVGYGPITLREPLKGVTSDKILIVNGTFRALNEKFCKSLTKSASPSLELAKEGQPESMVNLQADQVSVEEFAEKLRVSGEDEKVILALVKKTFGLRPGQIALQLGYASHLEKYPSRRRMTATAIKKGEEMLEQMEKSK